MEFLPTAIRDVILIQVESYQDARGFFMETYHARLFAEAGLPTEFVQDNHSGSRKGVLRGLHFQVRHAQGKLVRAVVGEVFDVAVDLRQNSPTFGKWVGQHLSAENRNQLWIPPGFAHGFLVLSDWAEITYKVTDFYAPEWERTLLWNDPEVQISWPVLQDSPPVLSRKDAAGRTLQELIQTGELPED